MWRALDLNLSGWVSLREFDEYAFELLGGLRCWSLSNFGSVANMFRFIDVNEGGDVTWKEFTTTFAQFSEKFDIGLDDDDLEYLFNGLDLDGKKRITLDELDFLEKWDLALDLEEEQVFPRFRLFTTGHENKAMVKTAIEIVASRRPSEAASEAVGSRRPSEAPLNLDALLPPD
jgi:hypothetical protein